jgi:hypothetical protein
MSPGDYSPPKILCSLKQLDINFTKILEETTTTPISPSIRAKSGKMTKTQTESKDYHTRDTEAL